MHSPKAKHGFMNLTGIDYSSASVELATNILAEEGLTNIKVQVRCLHCVVLVYSGIFF